VEKQSKGDGDEAQMTNLQIKVEHASFLAPLLSVRSKNEFGLSTTFTVVMGTVDPIFACVSSKNGSKLLSDHHLQAKQSFT